MKNPIQLLSVALLFAVPAAAQSYAVELSPGSEIRFPHHVVMNTGEAVTIEAWIKRSKAGGGPCHVFSRYKSGVHKALEILGDGSIAFLYAGSPWAHGLRTAAGSFPADGVWHHLAFTRHQGGKYEIYVDGKTILAAGPGPCWLTCAITSGTVPTMVGMSASNTNPWAMAALRVSTTDRYTGSFIPQLTWAADNRTAMLLLFPEGKGSTTRGASSQRQLGTLNGAVRWIPRNTPKASFRVFGKGCGSDPTRLPTLSSSSLPRLGKNFTLQVSNLTPGQIGMIMLGNSDKSWNGQALPLSLGRIGMPNCQLLVSYDYPVPVLTGNGILSWTGKVPPGSQILGSPFFVQVWAPDQKANALGVQMSNGGHGVVGF